jgi:hypothetical protein
MVVDRKQHVYNRRWMNLILSPGRCFTAIGVVLILALEARAGEKKLTEIVSQEVIGTIQIKPRAFKKQQWLAESIEISPDGRRIAYVEQSSGGWRVVVNGSGGPVYDNIARGFAFSQDGKRFAYVASKGDRHANVVDGKEGRFYSDVMVPKFNRDGQHFWYIALEGTNYFLVMDDLPQAIEAKPVAKLVLSPDGMGIAYIQTTDEGERVVVNGKGQKAYDFIEVDTLTSSAENNRLGYIAARGAKRLPEKKPGSFKFTLERKLEEMPGYESEMRARNKAKRIVVINEQEGPDYDLAYRLTFSPDGKRYSYVAQRGNEFFVVVDGVEGKHYKRRHSTTDVTEGPVFSSDSRKVAYSVATRLNEYYVVNDWKEEGPYPGSGIASGSLIFSPDGERLAYVAQIGKMRRFFLVVDGIASKQACLLNSPYFTAPVFSADGKDIVFAAAFLHINGKLERDFKGIVPGGIKFVGPDQFQHISLDMDDTIRIVQRKIVRD